MAWELDPAVLHLTPVSHSQIKCIWFHALLQQCFIFSSLSEEHTASHNSEHQGPSLVSSVFKLQDICRMGLRLHTGPKGFTRM